MYLKNRKNDFAVQILRLTAARSICIVGFTVTAILSPCLCGAREGIVMRKP